MNSRNAIESRHRQILAALLTAAILVRVGVRMAFGEADFWTNSYSAYYAMADNVASGKGFCFGTTCAWWPPLYPLFLALTTLGGKHYLLIVVPQALMGAGTSLCAFLIGRHLFDTSAGILACCGASFYPYYAMHDTALQETGMVTFWTALSVWLLLRASEWDRHRDWFLAGLAIGLIALTRASVAPIAGMALLWTAIWGAQGNAWLRLRKSSLVVLACLVMIAPWLIRTYRLTGAAVLSSQTGRALWIGNNPLTFSAYPARSIDESEQNAWAALTPADLADLKQAESSEIQESDWFAHRALTYIRAHPGLILLRAFRKVGAGFSWRLNPLRQTTAQLVYAFAYVPVAVLGMIGMFLARRNRGVILIAMLFLSFMVVTAVFWAHTSHRSYLDIYWIVLASSVVAACPAPAPSRARR